MTMSHPLRMTHDEGWATEITEQPGGSLQVIVSGMVRREWRGTRETIEAAIALAYQIRREQQASATPAAPPDAAAAPIEDGTPDHG